MRSFTLVQDLRIARRGLTRRLGLTVAAGISLALGIGAATAVYSVAQAVLVRPLPLPGSDRLALLWNRSPANPQLWLSQPEVEDLRREARSLSGVAALRDWSFALTGPAALDRPEEVPAAAVSAELFPLLRIRPALGRFFTAAEDRPGAGRVALLSHELWSRRFAGDPAVVGRTVALDGIPTTIVGVLPAGFQILPPSSVFPARVDVWVPLETVLGGMPEGRDVRHLHALARLAPGVSAAAAQSELDGLARRLRHRYPTAYEEGSGLSLVPFKEQIVGRLRPALRLLSAAVALLLLLVSANVANLLLASHAGRRRELAIRAALGAGRGRLARQLLVEALLLAALGAAGGLALADAGLDVLRALGPAGLPRLAEATLDGSALAFALASGFGTTLLFGLAPALAAAGTAGFDVGLGVGRNIGRSTSPARGGARARRVLAVAEIALALTLAVASGLTAKSLLRLQGTAPGFDAAGAVALRLSLPAARYPDGAQRAAFFAALTERLAAHPGVRAAGAVTHLPLSGAYLASGFVPEGGDSNEGRELGADLRGVTPGYFRALGIPLLKGRDLGAADGAESPPVAVVDEAFAARAWPGREPIGRRLRWIRGGEPIEVVGVVRAVRHAGLDSAPEPTVYRPYAQYSRATSLFVVLRGAAGGGGAGALAAAARREIERLDPGLPVADLRSMAERLDDSVARPRFQALLFALFAATALGLATAGVYGVVSYGVAGRTRELGIRMAVGARPGDLLRLVLAEGLAMAGAGVAIGLFLAAAASRAMAGLLFGVVAIDPAVFLAAPALLAGATLLACYLPARRAAGLDPLAALGVD